MKASRLLGQESSQIDPSLRLGSICEGFCSCIAAASGAILGSPIQENRKLLLSLRRPHKSHTYKFKSKASYVMSRALSVRGAIHMLFLKRVKIVCGCV